MAHQACVTQQAGYRQAAKYQPDIRPAVSWPSVRLLAYLRNGTWRNRKTKRHNRMSVKTLVILMSALAGIVLRIMIQPLRFSTPIAPPVTERPAAAMAQLGTFSPESREILPIAIR